MRHIGALPGDLLSGSLQGLGFSRCSTCMDAASAESKQMLLTAWEVGGPACGLSFTVGALILTYTILGVPHYTPSRMPPKPYSIC